MKKTLHYSLLAIFALICGVANAETKVVDFTTLTITATTTGFTLDASPFTFTAEKNNGSSTPTQNANDKDIRVYAKGSLTVASSGTMTKMVFAVSKAGKKRLATITPSVGNAVSDSTNWTVTWTSDVPVSEVTLTVGEKADYGTDGNSKAGQFNVNNVEITYEQGTAPEKADPELAFSAKTAEGKVGEAFTAPTLTKKTDGKVTYSSSKESVAKVDAETGVVTLVSAGTAIIEAKTPETDTYRAGTASYTLTVTDDIDISNTPETAYTVAQANDLITAGRGLDTEVYIKGKVVSIKELSTSFGNATYYISDDGTETAQLMVYRGYSLGGAHFTADDELKAGDEVVVYGKLVNYSGTYEVSTGSSIYSLNGKTKPAVDITNTPETAYTVARANELITAGEGLAAEVYVKGKVVSVKEISTNFGNATYYISDDGTETAQLMVYRGYWYDGKKFESENAIKAGDEVVVYGKLVNYSGTYEVSSGSSIYSINGVLSGIATVKTDAGTEDKAVFNMAGQRLSKPAKGVNIIGGKKIVVK